MQTKEEKAASSRAYYAIHRAERVAYRKAYRETHKAEIAALRKADYAANREAILADRKTHYAKNKADILAQHKAYNARHTEECAARKKAYRLNHLEEAVSRDRAYYRSHKAARNEYSKASYAALRTAIIKRLGGCCIRCASVSVLEFHHANFNGEDHRKMLGGRDSSVSMTYPWMLTAALSEVLHGVYAIQLLCRTCHKLAHKRRTKKPDLFFTNQNKRAA